MQTPLQGGQLTNALIILLRRMESARWFDLHAAKDLIDSERLCQDARDMLAMIDKQRSTIPVQYPTSTVRDVPMSKSRSPRKSGGW